MHDVISSNNLSISPANVLLLTHRGVVGVSAAYAKMAQSGLGARPVNISDMALSLRETRVIFS